MSASFSDITLYKPTPHKVGTPEYWEDTALTNFVSDLYVQKMHGYKPPKTSRVTLQPAYYNIWKGSNRFGSIVSFAPYFSYEDFSALDIKGRYQYILDLIQAAMLQLSDELGWDKRVFERAYSEVVASDFHFSIGYPQKQSRDRRKKARVWIEKTNTVTVMLVEIEVNGAVIKRKLFDKKNGWWYDAAYLFTRHTKWFDNNRFGISYEKHQLEISYAIEQDEVVIFEKGERVNEIDAKTFVLLE